MFPPNACVQPEGFENMIKMISRVNKNVKADDPVSQFIDTQYCPQ